MITLLDSKPWVAADLTGNSALVTVGASLYAVGGLREGEGHGIYRSLDNGATWDQVALLPVPHGSTDPAVALGTNQTDLLIVLAKPNPSTPVLTDVVLYRFSTATLVLESPLVLVAGSRQTTAYDVTALKDDQGADAGALVILGAQEPSTPTGFTGKYVLFAVEVALAGTMVHTPLEQSHWSTGETCGAMTLLSPPSGNLEAFYTSHPRSFTFKDSEVKILRRVRTAANTWEAGNTLTTYTGRFTDDKLTVIPTPGNGRAVSQAFHRWTRARGLQTCVTYGLAKPLQGGTSWEWHWGTLVADDYASIKEPVIESDGTNLYLAYLNCPWLTDQSRYAQAGFLQVADVDPNTLGLTTRQGPWSGLRFRWLRGTKDVVAPASRWALLGIGGNDSGGTGPVFYISQFNLPPHVVLTPTVLVARRGVPTVLDASATLDPDLDSLTYTWTHNAADTAHVHLTPTDGGKKATLLVDKGIGPDATSFTVTVTVSDGQAGHEQTAASAVTVPANTPPVIAVVRQIDVTRNTTVDIKARVTDSDQDTLKISWEQLSGTPVVLTGTDQATVSVGAFRMHPEGEDVVLQVTADDGVNDPVTAEVTLHVSAIAERDLDAGEVSRAFYLVGEGDGTFPATISQRHGGRWGQADTLSGPTSDFFQVEVMDALVGPEQRCYTSPKSLLVLLGENDGLLQRYPPAGERITDSAQDELGQSYMLTDQNQILRYTSAGYTEGSVSVSDWPDNAISLGDLTSGSFSHLHVEPTSEGRRVLVVHGHSGVFLFQVMEDTFEVVDTLVINTAAGILPVDRVNFLRTSGLLNLKGGKVLVGVVDASGFTTEVLVDLEQRRAVGTWDRSNLLSRTAYTGELLQASSSAADLGHPSAPVWLTPELQGDGRYLLLWSQARPDLVGGYEVWLGLDAAAPALFAVVPSGSIRRLVLPTQAGHTYHLTIRAQGSSSSSAFSEEQTIIT